jgi:ElaB/YqjD/DUF883 family membrane-anchored ribosome-binding protein
MSGEETKNVASSAAMSGSKPPKSELQSEAEFLAVQAADAHAAIQQTLDDLRESLKTAADVRLWTRQHPWASVATAAAVGFAAANAITASWHTAVEPEEEPPPRPTPPPSPTRAPSPSVANRIAGFLFDLAKETLTAFAATAMRSNLDGDAQGTVAPPAS